MSLDKSFPGLSEERQPSSFGPGFNVGEMPRLPGIDRGVEGISIENSAGGIATVRYPFDPSLAAGVVTFWPGTVNNVLPTNYLTGVAVTGTKYLTLNVTTNNGKVTTCTFTADAAQPGDQTPTIGVPPTSFKVLIAIFSSGVVTKVWENKNVQAQSVLAFRTPKATPEAGSPPYNEFYTWVIR